MRKCLIVIISGFVLSFICSCLPTSIYPASNKKDSIIDSTLIGDWKTDHDNSDAIIKIRLTNDSLYSVVMYENKSNSNAMINYLARITKIDSFYIASFETDIDSILKNKYNISHTSMISTYFFIKFKIISNNKISYSLFSFLDMSDPFKKYLIIIIHLPMTRVLKY